MEQFQEKALKLVEVCSICGKRREQIAKGSMTSWLFRHNHCQCDVLTSNPESQKNADIELQRILLSTPELGLDSRFAVLGLIGQGGMGAVYKVQDRSNERILAAKVLRPELLSDEAAVKRFKQEAQTAMNLSHLNLVRVEEYGVTTSGAPYIIMEYVDGTGLDLSLQEHCPMPTEEAVCIFDQICAALEYMHGQKIVHRDLKPSNIILTSSGSQILVKIVDFGIAKIFSETLNDRLSQLTSTGELLGSPPYMSPEQCTGHVLDARSDIYSFGLVMYHTLAGFPPFSGENSVQVIVQQLNERAADFSKRGVSVPKDLSSIVFRCLEKSPEDRYNSAVELREDLRRFIEGKPPRKRSLLTVARRFGKRRFRELSASLLAMLLLAFGGYQLVQMSRSSLPLETQWHNLDKQGQDDLNHGRLAEANQRFLRELDLAREAKDKGLIVASLNELVDLSHMQKKSADNWLKEIASLKQDASFSQDLLQELDRQLQSAKTLETDPKKISQLQRLCNDAIDAGAALFSAGDYAGAADLYDKARELALKTLGNKDRSVYRSTNNLAMIAHEQGDFSKAIAGYNQAIKIASSSGDTENPGFARTYMELARAYVQTGSNLDLAEDALYKAMKISTEKIGANSQQVGWCKYQLATLFAQRGELDRAKSTLKSAITIYESDKSSKPSHLARCYALLGMLSGNVLLCQKALSIFESETDKDYMFLCQDLLYLAELYGGSEPKQSELFLQRAEALTQRFSKENSDYMNASLYRTLSYSQK